MLKKPDSATWQVANVLFKVQSLHSIEDASVDVADGEGSNHSGFGELSVVQILFGHLADHALQIRLFHAYVFGQAEQPILEINFQI